MSALTSAVRFAIDTGRKALAGRVVDLGASMAAVSVFGFLQNAILSRMLGQDHLPIRNNPSEAGGDLSQCPGADVNAALCPRLRAHA